MTEQERIAWLVERVVETGRAPEEVCREHPELLGAVRERWRRYGVVAAEVEALFPTARAGERGGGLAGGLGGGEASRELPRIRGYEVEAVIGMGGMGVVYRARHLSLKRTVAIKMARAGVYATEQELACLRLEAQAVAGLRHPHIVQVYDAGDVEGRPYFSMEYVEGGSLARALGGVPQPSGHCARLVMTLADAVASAHAAGIVHRDLKPGNILLTGEGTPKVADFSLARRLEAASQTQAGVGVGAGTPSYMAPEQAMGRAEGFCPAVDVYALGAVLYEMLTGRPPFRAETPSETQRQVIESEPAPPSRLNARTPRDLETICLVCLRKDPQHRYGSAAALAADLGRYLRGEPITARRTGSVEVAIKWVRRRPGAASATAAALVVIGLGSAAGVALGLERAALVRAVEEDVGEARRREEAGDWKEARVALGRATARLGVGGVAELRERVAGVARELDLAEGLAEIRLRRAGGDQDFNRRKADGQYEAAFAEAGLGAVGEAAEVVAARVDASPVRAAVVAALDDWTICATEPARRVWLMEVTRRADPSPGWRDRVRTPATWGDPAALAELAAAADVEHEPVTVLLILARLLDHSGGDAVELARRVQLAHPSDFWTNFVLAELLDNRGDADAVGCYRAALAARPDAEAAWVNLGVALLHQGRAAEAEQVWERAVALDPRLAIAHFNLAAGAYNRGDLARAVAYGREAARLDPGSGGAHALLGQALMQGGSYAEAEPVLRRALGLVAESDPLRPFLERDAEKALVRLELERRLPALVRGEERSASGAESEAIAEMLIHRGNDADAVRFFEDAFARAPELAEARGSSSRYNAACCAAATAGRLGPGEAERAAGLRKRALGWLRAELAAWGRELASEEGERRTAARTALTAWSSDADLAGVREPAERARLPEEERSGWDALWRDVNAALAG